MTLLLLTRSTSYFYPRSPCGERLMYALIFTGSVLFLSTLSLRRATVMDTLILANAMLFLSTLSLRRATTKSDQGANSRKISIHALLAESDRGPGRSVSDKYYFYPRSPCGERPKELTLAAKNAVFLSTLSLRRATAKVHKTVGHFCAYETNFMGIASSC